MTAIFRDKSRPSVTRWGVAMVVVLAVGLSGVFLIAPARATSGALTGQPASGAPEEWAFGGHAAVSYSCQDSGCFNDSSFVGSFSLSYYVGWAVLYTRTNVSATQTMIEGLAAINASVHVAFSETLNGTTESLGASLSGLETAAGFTNLTDGTVALTSASNSTTWTSPALAVMNAASSEGFNLSGAYSLQNGSRSLAADFDLGGHEASAVTFTPSLGMVPLDPQPGDTWTAAAPFAASGSWTSGYSFSYSGAYGGAASVSNWTSRAVTRSGVLGVNGTDLGALTLYDNYTSPPTLITAQEILLEFGSGAFTATDGWIFVPSELYSGATSGLFGTGVSSPSSGPTNETAYYDLGSGFVGAGLAGSTSLPVGSAGGSPMSINVQAGPEPVGVAQQQYNAITSGSGSSNGFPWVWVVVAVVVVLVAVIGLVLAMRRSRIRRPPPAVGTPSAAPPVPGPSETGGPASGAPNPPGPAPPTQ